MSKSVARQKTNSVVGDAITRWGKAGLGHDGDRGSRHREMAPPTQPRTNYNLNWCKTKPFHEERDELAAKRGQSQKKFHRYRVRSFPETLSVNSGREEKKKEELLLRASSTLFTSSVAFSGSVYARRVSTYLTLRSPAPFVISQPRSYLPNNSDVSSSREC